MCAGESKNTGRATRTKIYLFFFILASCLSCLCKTPHHMSVYRNIQFKLNYLFDNVNHPRIIIFKTKSATLWPSCGIAVDYASVLHVCHVTRLTSGHLNLIGLLELQIRQERSHAPNAHIGCSSYKSELRVSVMSTPYEKAHAKACARHPA